MCGIYFSSKMYSQEILRHKMQRINFRGPDFSAIETIDNMAVLAHNRLSIIDLDARANQPFHHQHLVVVFNGEIYNFQSLKIDLQKQGHQFKTSSDTEVLAALYLQHGKNFLTLLNGMFAFVIFDKNTNSIFAARDRFGKKPFYYRLQNNTLECASQPSQIAIGNQLIINQQAISQFLTYRYIPEPASIYSDVYKLESGYSLSYKIGDDKTNLEKYWELPDNAASYGGNYNDAKNELENLFADAVKIRMVADVPLGCFLSGGIDSSLIAALASKNVTQKLKTFSVQFDELEFDESSHATETAKYLGTDHTNIPCQINDGIELIENFATYFDEPFGDSSAIPTMLLSKATKQFVTVALSGDGGDEGFFGYNFFNSIQQTKWIFDVPFPLRNLFAKSLQPFSHKKISSIARLMKMKNENDLVKNIFELKSNGLAEKQQPCTFYDFIFENKNNLALQKALDYNIKFWLNNDSNVKVDRASMSASLEVRSPLLDFRVIEFARTLPTSFSFENGEKKKILKDILYQYVPKEMMNRPKRGFTVPFELWFRNELKDLVMETLCDANLKKLPMLDANNIHQMVANHIGGKENNYTTIWNLVVLMNWLKRNNATI